MNKKIVLSFFIVSASSIQAVDIPLTWNDNSDNEKGFIVERSVDGGEFAQVGATEENVNKFTDADVPLGKQLTYRVYAFNDYGDSGYSNTVTEATFPPQKPDGLKKGSGNPVAWMNNWLKGVLNRKDRG